MNKQIDIKYHKWNKKDCKKLTQSISTLINLKNIQFYMPFFSLFYYIHNTPLSHKIIDLERKYYLLNLNEIIKERYYNSNLIMKGEIYNSHKNSKEEKEIFCKTISILDPIHCINNNYNLITKNNYHLPSCYNHNAFSKINNIDNSAYIDTFCSYLFSQLTMNKVLPSFPIYYGSVNGIGEYRYDMTEEYDDFKMDKCFNKNLGKSFKLDIYLSDTESETEESSSEESDSEESDSEESDSEESEQYYQEDYVAKLKNVPIQLLFIEKLEATLEDYLLSEEFNEETLLSCLFQISFSLQYLQKNYQFTHNDLHINNIMYSSTETKYLYYKFNNKYFRIPTYGKIFKIIDFGRAIITYKNKTYMNDVFSRYGEAGGQYYYPPSINFYSEKNNNEKIKPNYNFDLCRLSMTIIEELDLDKVSENTKSFIYKMCEDRYKNNFCEMEDDFNLYISIAKDAVNSLPLNVINHKIYKKFLVKKKNFPLKSYYSMN